MAELRALELANQEEIEQRRGLYAKILQVSVMVMLLVISVAAAFVTFWDVIQRKFSLPIVKHAVVEFLSRFGL